MYFTPVVLGVDFDKLPGFGLPFSFELRHDHCDVNTEQCELCGCLFWIRLPLKTKAQVSVRFDDHENSYIRVGAAG